jgi:hypothetical protein
VRVNGVDDRLVQALDVPVGEGLGLVVPGD